MVHDRISDPHSMKPVRPQFIHILGFVTPEKAAGTVTHVDIKIPAFNSTAAKSHICPDRILVIL